MRTAFTELVGVEHPLAGFSRSPAVVVEVSRAGALGVLGATMYTPDQLDAQLTWIDERLAGRPYGVDLLVPAGRPARARRPGTAPRAPPVRRPPDGHVPPEHQDFVDDLLAKYGDPAAAGGPRAGPHRPDRPQPGDQHRRRGGPRPARGDVRAPGRPGGQRAGHAAAGDGRRAPARPACRSPRWWARGSTPGGSSTAGVDLLVAQGTEGGGHTGNVATMVLTPEVVDLAGRRAGARRGRHRDRPPARRGPRPGRGRRVDRLGVALQPRGPGRRRHQGQAAGRAQHRHRRLHRRAPASPPGSCAARGSRRGHGPGRRRRCPCRGSPRWCARRGSASTSRRRRAIARARELESFFVGQVVGSFTRLRPAGEIVRDIVAGCEQRLRELAEFTARDLAG